MFKGFLILSGLAVLATAFDGGVAAAEATQNTFVRSIRERIGALVVARAAARRIPDIPAARPDGRQPENCAALRTVADRMASRLDQYILQSDQRLEDITSGLQLMREDLERSQAALRRRVALSILKSRRHRAALRTIASLRDQVARATPQTVSAVITAGEISTSSITPSSSVLAVPRVAAVPKVKAAPRKRVVKKQPTYGFSFFD